MAYVVLKLDIKYWKKMMKNIYQTNINPRLKVMHLLDTMYYRAIVIHSDKQDSYTI